MRKNKVKNEEPKTNKRGRSVKEKQDVAVLETHSIIDSEDSEEEIDVEYTYPLYFNINQEIFTRLTHYINTQGHTFYHLGKKVGVSHNYFTNVRKNNSSIGSEIIVRILYYYQNLSADWLLLGEGEMSRAAKSEWDSKKLIERNQEIEKLHAIIKESKKQSEVLYRQALTVKWLSEERTDVLKGNLFERATQRFMDKLSQEIMEEQEYFPENDDATYEDSVPLIELEEAISEMFNPTTLPASTEAVKMIERIVGTELFRQLCEYGDDFKKNYELLKRLTRHENN